MFKTRNGEMTEWHLIMWDMVNPYNYRELPTFKSVIFRLTEALFRLTGVPFRHWPGELPLFNLAKLVHASQLTLDHLPLN